MLPDTDESDSYGYGFLFQSLLGCFTTDYDFPTIITNILSIPFGMLQSKVNKCKVTSDTQLSIPFGMLHDLVGFVNLRSTFALSIPFGMLLYNEMRSRKGKEKAFNPFWDASMLGIICLGRYFCPFNPFWDASRRL